MAYKVNLLQAAAEDLDNILDWYVSQKPSLAERFYEAYFKVEDRIHENPLQFPLIEGEIRRAILPKPFNYLVFFFVEDQSAIVVAIFNNRRNPDIWKDRIE
ncbi:MAG: type II toxin-antitoxin system RelE/ParE family toxin [Chitinophagales bacterium]